MMKASAPLARVGVLSKKIRNDERYRRALITTSTSVCTKAISAVSAFISIAAVVRHLGPERYGLYATVTSLTTLLAFADLGIGNGLITAIARAQAGKSWGRVKKLISGAFLLLTAVSTVLALAFFTAYPKIPWPAVFNVRSSQAVSEAGLAAAAFVVCFLITQPLSIVQKVHMGLQEGYVNDGWTAASSVLALAGLLVGIKFGLGTPGLLLAIGLAPIVALTASNLTLFGYAKPRIRPDLSSIDREIMEQIFRSGMLFLVLQLAIALAFVSDHFVITQLIGPTAVADYSIPSRLFGMVQFLVAMGLGPMWPAYGEALASRDFGWVKRTFTRTIKLAFVLSGTASLVLLVAGPALVRLIGGSAIKPSVHLMVALAIWTVLGSVGNAISMFLNGANIIRFQVITASLMAITAIVSKIWLVQAIGIPGAVWGTIIGYTLFSLLPCVVYVPRLLKTICQESL